MILYEARCNAGVVTMMDGIVPVTIPDCKILGAGKAPNSTGIVIADETRFWYIPLLTNDISAILDSMLDITDKLNTAAGILTKSSALIDSASTAAGIAAFVPSVATGTAMATEATTLQTEIATVKTAIQKIQQTLA